MPVNTELIFGLFAQVIPSTCKLLFLPHIAFLDAFLVLP